MNDTVAKTLSLAGWRAETYRSLHPDLSAIGDADLVKHFLSHGILEGRRYHGNASKSMNLDRIVLTADLLIVYGWSTAEFDYGVMCLPTEDDPLVGGDTMLSAHLVRFWRNDVAAHLGVAPRTVKHGFLAIFQIDALNLKLPSQPVLLAGGLAQRTKLGNQSDIKAQEAMIEVYRYLESIMVYEELLLVLGQHPLFVETMATIHKASMRNVPITEMYDSQPGETSEISICALALGNAAQLKVWLMDLCALPGAQRFEINVLCNGPMEYQHVYAACRWVGEVLGRKIRLFFAQRNIGFNNGVNAMVVASSGRHVLVTNTDVRYRNFDLDRLIALCDSPTICVARQFNSMGALQHLGLKLEIERKVVHGEVINTVSSTLLGRNTYEDPKAEVDIEVEHFGAAAIFGERTLLAELGPFNPGFLYAYHEDTDLALRATAAGVRMVVTSALDIVHYESSAARIDLPKTFLVATNTIQVTRSLGL